MKLLTNKENRNLLLMISGLFLFHIIWGQVVVWFAFRQVMPALLAGSVMTFAALIAACFFYFYKQHKIMEGAISQIHAYLAGNVDVRIACNYEGELYQLFHAVNTLAAVLNAHAENEQRSKDFLKDTISDISHQLKTPLAALNIYNGLLQQEAEALPAVKEFVSLSEQELDRMETLVKNLLKITRLDAGTMTMEGGSVNIADMMRDIELHFTFRAKQEHKRIALSGLDSITLFCDRDWMTEALSNLVKNALDHTAAGDQVTIQWKEFPSGVRIFIQDNGEGIHAEDIYHIFKRFYRSRFSADTQGIGLGLPLAKAIIEAHGGNITVESTLGAGSTFTIHFLNPTKL